MANQNPLPSAKFPPPPPMGNIPPVDPRNGRWTVSGLEFMTSLWAAVGGSGGTYALIKQLQAAIAVIFGMHGDGTLSKTGELTVTSSEDRPFVTSAFVDTTNADNIDEGTLALQRLPAGVYPFPWRPQGSLAGVPAASQQIFSLPTKAGNFLPTDLNGSLFNVAIAPTADATFQLLQNAAPIGTVLFPAGQTLGVPTFTETTFADDDQFILLAPSVVDATLSGFSFLIVGTRTQ